MAKCDICGISIPSIQGGVYCRDCKLKVKLQNKEIIQRNLETSGIDHLITKKFVHEPKPPKEGLRTWCHRKGIKLKKESLCLMSKSMFKKKS